MNFTSEASRFLTGFQKKPFPAALGFGFQPLPLPSENSDLSQDQRVW